MKLWQRETIEGVPVIRVPLYPEHSRSAWRRVLNYVSFALSAAMLGPWLVPRVDVIHFHHPPLTAAFPAWILSRLFRTRLTCEIQDMWPETLAATGMVRGLQTLKIVGWCAKRVYRRVNAIRVISPGFRDNLVQKGVPPENIHVISNWVDTDFYRPREADAILKQKLGLADRFNLMFAGTMGLAQGLETVLDAAGLLADLPRLQFVFVGDGADSGRLQELSRERGLSNVKFLGRYPEAEMPGVYALADAMLIHLRDDPLFRITIPHKVFTALASAKPLLMAMEGDAADVVRTAGAGITCQPSNSEALANAARSLCAAPPAELQAMGDNGRRAVVEHYGRDRLVARVIEMLQSVIKK
jgi:colanic acid biosynthesis glycosyl transferase WcaI